MLFKAKLVLTLVASITTAGVVSPLLEQDRASDKHGQVQAVQERQQDQALIAAQSLCISGCGIGHIFMGQH